MPLISRLRIKNFRSIRELEIDCNYLTLFVGQNDSGKSNVLRALNLFFNEEDAGFDFEIDHNLFNRPEKRAREIKIEIDINLPESYHRLSGDFIRWTKVWRDTGLYYNEYKGFRIRENRLGNTSYEEVEVPRQSHVHTLLRRIQYIYVPAIKDTHYFDKLRGRIYKTISQVAARTFRQSSQSFETSIGEHLSELTNDITQQLKIDTKLALPKDLGHIFERLDFLSGDQEISLDQRGDGIKARHIPLILKFITEQRKATQGRGAVPYTFIWGYEEPENNVEMVRAFDMADDFWDYMYDDVARIFITTHSPIFYNLIKKNKQDEEFATVHSIFMSNAEAGTATYKQSDLLDIDERMGVVQFVAPRIEGIKDELESLRKAVSDFEKSRLSAKIFVEGESDKILIDKAIQLFSPDNVGRVAVETKTPGGGHNYVKDQLIAWHHFQKHKETKLNAAGIFDRDNDAKKSKRLADDSTSSNPRISRSYLLPVPPHLQEIMRNGYKVPIALEHIAPPQIWREWQARGWLSEIDKVYEIFPEDIRELVFRGHRTVEECLAGMGDSSIYVSHVFGDDHKIQAANEISQRTDVDQILLPLQDWLTTHVLSHLT